MKTMLLQKTYTFRISTLACLIAGVVGVSPALKADEESVSKLLAQAKTQSYAISVDATTLESYTRQPSLNWTTHASEIQRMKEDINMAAKTVTALNDAKGGAAPWQQTAIDRIIPYLREIADDTTAAIEYLNKNQTRLKSTEYKDYIEANSDTSQELATLIAHFVDYGNHKSRYDSLKKSLELPGK
jgi:hypothetical protein